MTSDAQRQKAWIAWAAVCFLWGTTYLGIKICLETIPPFLMGGLRYTAAGLLLLGWMAVRGRALPTATDWRRHALLGFFMIVIGHGGVVWGEQYVSSGLTAVMVGTNAFWISGLDALFPGGQRLRLRQWVGMAIGFSGIVLLVWPDISKGGAGAQGLMIGVVVLQLACVGWALGSAWTRRHHATGDLVGGAGVQMLVGGLCLLVIGSLTREWPDLSINARTGVAFLYLTIPGAAIAFAAFSYALRHLPVTIASLYVYVNPVIAVLLGALVLGEPLHVRMIAAVAVIITGMAVVGRR